MSSITIIIKAYNDMNLMGKPYAPQIFGALVFEDLIAILLMVLLSAMAVTGKFEGKEMLAGKTLRQLDMRKNSCMVVSMMDKNGHHTANPSPDHLISVGDIVWIAGEKSSVEWYISSDFSR